MHKDFQSARRAHTGEAITFTVNNQTYEAIPDAPAAALLDATALADGSSVEKMRAIGEFLDKVLLPESRERLERAMRSQDATWNVTLEDAIEVVRWLVSEVYVGRPTMRPSTSPGMPLPAGPSSMTAVPNAG
jgi:hypothetical protein